MNCPRCQRPLRDFEDVHVCVSCGGAFLAAAATNTVRRALDDDAQDVAALAAKHAERSPAAGTGVDHAAACPTCRATMRRFRVGPVDVDTCLDHGTWYDRGELAQVKEALEQRLPTTEVPLDAAAPPPAPAPSTSTGSLELARDPRARKPPRPQMTRGGVIDPGVQQKINDLARREQWEEEERNRIWRDRGRHHHHDRHGVDLALDLITDVLRFLR